VNHQYVVRVPRIHRKQFTAMLDALGGAAHPSALIGLLIDYANTPEGGAWIKKHYSILSNDAGIAWDRAK